MRDRITVVRDTLPALAGWFEFMFIAYVIEDKTGKRYTGYTANLEKRIWEHNNKVTITTRKGTNWKIIYKKEFNNKTEAILFEKYLKTGKGREYLKSILLK